MIKIAIVTKGRLKKLMISKVNKVRRGDIRFRYFSIYFSNEYLLSFNIDVSQKFLFSKNIQSDYLQYFKVMKYSY